MGHLVLSCSEPLHVINYHGTRRCEIMTSNTWQNIRSHLSFFVIEGVRQENPRSTARYSGAKYRRRPFDGCRRAPKQHVWIGKIKTLSGREKGTDTIDNGHIHSADMTVIKMTRFHEKPVFSLVLFGFVSLPTSLSAQRWFYDSKFIPGCPDNKTGAWRETQ